MDLGGQTALVTGSTDGVGRRVAQRLGEARATVLVHGRSRERGEQLVRELRASGSEGATFYRADLSSLAETRARGHSAGNDRSEVAGRPGNYCFGQ